MTPEQIARTSESSQQKAFFAWAALSKIPELKYMHAIANGGARGDTSRSRMIRGAQLKAEGVKPGVPDIFLPAPRGGKCGLYIEFKAPDKPIKISDAQVNFLGYADDAGYSTAVVKNWQDAAKVTCAYLGITNAKI